MCLWHPAALGLCLRQEVGEKVRDGHVNGVIADVDKNKALKVSAANLPHLCLDRYLDVCIDMYAGMSLRICEDMYIMCLNVYSGALTCAVQSSSITNQCVWIATVLVIAIVIRK